MELHVYQDFLRRAERADSVRQLHQLVLEAQTDYPADPDADVVDRACWMHAQRLVERGRIHRTGRGAQPGDVFDWKERAAPA